jgi:hypothetical protein
MNTTAIRYSPRVALVACPFCREMFEKGEARTCPVCAMELADFDKLPPSLDATEDGVPTLPEHEVLPFDYWKRGRGALVVLAVVGLACFFLPWIHMTLPENVNISGFDLARKLGWSWGAAVAWVVLVPTIASRRTIAQLRGARVAAAFLSLFPAITVAIFLLRPVHGGRLVHVELTYTWAMYASLAISLLATAFSLRLGGSVADIAVPRGTSAGQVVH